MTPNRKQRRADKSNKARRLIGIYETYQVIVIMGLLSGSWYTSYSGVLAMTEFMSEITENLRRIALLVTASAMGAQFVLWHYVMRLIPLYATFAARGMGIFVIFVLMTALALSSTYTSFIGLTQDSARGLELQRQSDLYAEKARVLNPRVSAMNDALLSIEPSAVAACARYEQELASGAITGARGKGAVTGEFLKICQVKSSIATALKETIAANVDRMAKIQNASADLDQIIYRRAGSIGARELEFIALARQMDALLLELEGADRTKGLRASVRALSNSVAKLEDATGSLGAAQSSAIAGIITEERAFGDAFEGLIDEITALPLPTAGRAIIQPSQRLVLQHWQLHTPQLALAASMDLFAPISALLFWAGAMRARRSRHSHA